MKGGRILRTSFRLARLGAELAGAAAQILWARRDGQEVVHRLSRRLLRVMRVHLSVSGPVPTRGLVVCNHLGYLDILVLAATGPTVFVAKSEVRSWPVFGWFAQQAGTVFAQRARAGSTAGSLREITRALENGRRVILFPEGTSSGGSTVLPFKSALLEPGRGGAIWSAALAYGLPAGDGNPAEDICYWKDMSLLPHLLRILGKQRIRAELAFEPFGDSRSDRKALARELRARVLALKRDRSEAVAGPNAGFVCNGPPSA